MTSDGMATARPLAPVLALDIGNVCYHLAFDTAAGRFGYGSFQELAEQEPDLLPWSKQMEVGQVGEQEFLAGLGVRLPVSLGPRQLIEAWNSIIGPEIHGTAAAIRHARQSGLKIVFMSDIGPTHHRYVLETLSFIDCIDGEVVSYRSGALKPQPPMYEEMERLHCGGAVPCLYTDDKADNIATGTARGWPTYTFGDPAGLRAAIDRALEALETQG